MTRAGMISEKCKGTVLFCVKATGSLLGVASRLLTWLTSPPTLSHSASRSPGLPVQPPTVLLSLLSGCLGGSPKESQRGANKVRHHCTRATDGTGSDAWGQEVPCAQCGLSRLPESPEGLGAHHGVGGAGGRPQLCRPGLPDRARENEGLQEALSFRGAPTIMNLSRVSVSRVIWGDVYVYIFPRICSM